jgi:hypothetical protein
MEKTKRKRKTQEERLADMKLKHQQEANRIAALEKSVKEVERKKRTNRLIETGALAEQYFRLAGLKIEERKALFAEIVGIADVKKRLPQQIAEQGADKTTTAPIANDDTGVSAPRKEQV